MELIKKPYEISIWNMSPKEEKIATIGSHLMTSLTRAIEPTITRSVNGTITLQFKMHTQFFDSSLGRMIDNPYIPLLVVERVIKLKYKGKWYDLVIKNRTESSNQKMYTYTAKSLHIHELSKNGFDLEFNTELFNNQGTIFYLGKKIVEGTDWTIDETNSTFLRAYVEDQLLICRVITSKSIIGTDLITGTQHKISPNDYVYTFNSQWENFKNGATKKLQIIYISKPAKGSINNFDQYILDNGYYTDEGLITTGTLLEIETSKISKRRVSEFRGKYISKKQETRYNDVLGKYVTSYKYTSTKGKLLNVEGYIETEPVTVDLVQNFMVNSSNFEDTSGWYPKVKNNSYADIDVDIYPPLEVSGDKIAQKKNTYNSRLRISPSAAGQTIINTAFRSNVSKIKEIKQGDVFILRYRLKSSKEDRFVTVEKDKNNSFTNKIHFQFRLGGEIVAAKSTESPNTKTVEINGKKYNQVEITFQNSYGKDDIKDINFEFYIRDKKSVYFEDIQLFRKIVATPRGEKKERPLEPGEIPQEVVITKKYYYDTAINKDAKKPEDYKYLSPNNAYVPVYYEGYPKIASIEKSQSNRFNLIQELCETFECWADFVVEHDTESGKILSRKIQFKEYIGETKYSGFKYGINLKSIQRTIDSEQIVTKTIVKQNSNEHGKNGFCTIARAPDNPSGETFILNFDYYINQGLLDKESLQQDLYENFNKEGKGGFYSRLKALNSEIQKLNDNYSSNSTTLTQAQANLDAAEEIISSCEEQLAELYKQYKNYTSKNYPVLPDTQKTGLTDDKIVELATQIEWYKHIKTQSEEDRIAYGDIVSTCESNESSYTKSIKSKTSEKKKYINAFFKKYKNFIQEGTWNSEEYYNDNEYYLEGLNVSRTSSKPKITYTIDVVDISMLEGYESYEINVGDKTFIEDVEFFGYVFEKRGNTIFKRPYREEVVITEIKEDLDSPEKNQIKVQNYKTQFDDLFQRITAVTEQLQYATGGYNRASAAFNNDGTISASILQNTILSQAITLQNPKNGSVIWDGEGVKVVDQNNPNKLIQITSGRIAISEDGGKTTKLAITAAGINTSLLTAGQVNTDKILIGNSKDFAFRWDKIGLNAYYGDDNGYNYGKFVRFDKYGIYGYSKGNDFKPKNLDDVEDNADFGLTWNGFFLKSKHDDPNDNGYIKIDSKEDFQVFGSDGKRRIKIGLIGTETKNQTTTNEAGETVIETKTSEIYGLRIFDKNGNSVVDTNSDGNISITGTIKATSGNIGNWQISNGNLSSVKDDQGIILDATNSQIYSKQYDFTTGGTGWMINNDGAVFNNITLRGALKCAVLEYGEVQAVGGILMIRPSTTVKAGTAKYKEDASLSDGTTLGKVVEVTVENADFFEADDWCKVTFEIAKEDDLQKDENDQTIFYSGINTDLFKNLTSSSKNILRFKVSSPEEGEELAKKLNSPDKTVGIVNLGQIGSIGLGLNSSTNRAILPQTSFSVFSLEEESNVKYLKPHVILGKIPNDPITYGHLSDKFGLYTDSVKITGDSSFGALYLSKVDDFYSKTKKDIISIDNIGDVNLCIIPSGLGFGNYIKKTKTEEGEEIEETIPINVVNGLFKHQHKGGNWEENKKVYTTESFFIREYNIKTALETFETKSVAYFDIQFENEYDNDNIEKIEILFDHLGKKVIKTLYSKETDKSLTLPLSIDLSKKISEITAEEVFPSGYPPVVALAYLVWKTTLYITGSFQLIITSEESNVIKEYSLGQTKLGNVIAGFCEVDERGLLYCQLGEITERLIGPAFMSEYKIENPTGEVEQNVVIGVVNPNSSSCQLGEENNRWNVLYVKDINIDGKISTISTSSIEASSILTSSIETSSIKDSCFITNQSRGTDANGQKLVSHYLLPKKQETGEEGRHNYYIGSEEKKWTRIYSSYINATESSNTGISYNESGAGDASDTRVKNSITALSDEYSILFDKLNPVLYKYNNGNSNRFHTGFIAQEVEKAVIDSGLTTQDFAAVMHLQEIDEEGNEIDCYYLRYGEFVALNTSEIQKLKKRVTELENQLAKLTNKETVEPS